MIMKMHKISYHIFFLPLHRNIHKRFASSFLQLQHFFCVLNVNLLVVAVIVNIVNGSLHPTSFLWGQILRTRNLELSSENLIRSRFSPLNTKR
ncbi:Hypothetical predicted protein [Octopus vulgaris]|uniref:Transmembrane protein n=1 Tax=Octopus vulgaris TaxID=6645 RepID=A0AA36BFY0_OCTVU|nr:Hypothetical predicted protein [Octopus vulgaris]